MRRALALCAIAGAALFLLETAAFAPPDEKLLYLPTAQNDTMFAVVGLPEAPAPEAGLTPEPASESAAESVPVVLPFEQPSIVAHPEQESYPVGTKTVTLLVENRAEGDLLYSNWFAYFRVADDGQIPIAPRDGTMVSPEVQDPSLILKAGETRKLDVPLDIFDPPLTAGVYRAAQLACFADAGGNVLACTEITADFTIV